MFDLEGILPAAECDPGRSQIARRAAHIVSQRCRFIFMESADPQATNVAANRVLKLTMTDQATLEPTSRKLTISRR